MNLGFNFMMEEKITTVEETKIVDNFYGFVNGKHTLTNVNRYHIHAETGIIAMTSYFTDENENITEDELESALNSLLEYASNDIDTCKEYGAKYLVIMQLEGTTPDFYYICDDITDSSYETWEICEEIRNYLQEVMDKDNYHMKYGVVKDGKITNPHPIKPTNNNC